MSGYFNWSSCTVCGKDIYGSKRRKTCDDCKKLTAEEKENKKAERIKKETKHIKSIEEVQREARAHGMTYGRYVAYAKYRQSV